MRATAIIGANFGDEGKGHIVDFLADENAIVVRFNGGANAGHTVEADGVRRVFHHVGSGSLRGASTLLSEHFIVNPWLWEKEEQTTATYIHRDARLTTPYDMLVNQVIERSRGTARHGSCGVGINETATRCETDRATHVRDIGDAFELREMLIAGREHARTRLPFEPDPEFHSLLFDDGILDSFVASCKRMVAKSIVVADYEVLKRHPRILFEGAQGLLLDEHHRFFPHVTRSRTGTHNAREISEQLGADLDVVYVTRSYMTRHGAGPFPTEMAFSHPDPTNVPNPWQGTLRFGALDLGLLNESIRADSAGLDACLAVNCLDQRFLDPGEIGESVGLPVKFTSYGPRRDQIVSYAAG